MRLFLSTLIIILFTGIRLHAQDSDNYLQLFTNTGLNFQIDNPSAIENDQTINNAITIRVRSKKISCSIFAKIASFTYPFSFVPTSTLLSLEWADDNSNKDYNLIKTPISLQVFDQLLFNQKKMPGNSKVYDYNYNLTFKTPGYSLVPGNYNFTILFTMTQP